MIKLKSIRKDCGQFILPIKILNKLPRNKEFKVLDIGAGEHYIEKFLPKNIKYTSLDAVGKQDYVINLDKEKLPFTNKVFDIIICLETLEHTLSPHKIMREITRIAKDDAIFLLSMPNEYNFYCRLNFLFGKKTDVQESFQVVDKHLHIQLPRVKDILKFFEEYIKVQKIDYHWYSRSSEHSKAKNLTFMIDKILDLFSRIYPPLFTRTVVVKGIKK